MNTTGIFEEGLKTKIDNSILQLSQLRQQKGYTIEYVANKLHLKIQIIELIEKGEFHLLPEPVFIKGYLRAYSKLLGFPADPLLAAFEEKYPSKKKYERTLWQSKRPSHKAEYFIRWFTVLFAVGVVLAVFGWWQKNRGTQPLKPISQNTIDLSLQQRATNLKLNQQPSELKLTDLSKMHSLLAPKNPEMSTLEQHSG